MLGRDYLNFDGTSFPNPRTYKMLIEPIEQVNQSEAGTDLVSVTRLDKTTFQFTWHVSSTWMRLIKGLTQQTTCTLTFLEEQYTVRVRDFSADLVEDSACTEATDGLWRVTATAVEI